MDDVPEDNAILTLIVHQPAKKVVFIAGYSWRKQHKKGPVQRTLTGPSFYF
jgi:hypothetical protein